MNIQWKGSDDYYYARLEENFDKKEAIKELILKILALSVDKKDWNLLVLDKWIFNLGRLIGNIQNEDQAIGMDRGYRVGIQFLDYYNRLENSAPSDYDRMLEEISEEIENLIIEVIHEDTFRAKLKDYYKKNPFSIEISEEGQRIDSIFGI